MSAPSADTGEDASAGRAGTFRPLGEEVVHDGWRISVVRAEFAAPDGARFDREIVRHPGAVAVVPLTERDSVLLVRQYRGSVDRWLLEIPAGTRDVDGEDPAATAGRELAEEVGVEAGTMERLGRIYNTPGFCDEETILYLARELRPVPHDRHGHEEQHMEVVEVPLDDVDAMVASGELVDAQTVLGLLMVLERRRRDGPG